MPNEKGEIQGSGWSRARERGWERAFGAVRVVHDPWTQLIQELLEWADDPDSADWESIKRLS